MPVCIECRLPVPSLYTTYSRADDRSQGKGVRLTQCPRCRRFADKYVEHDFVVLFIDLVLIKPQVYRHLLFNRLGIGESDAWDPSIIRLGVLLLLFDVYLTWARIEKASPLHSGLSTQLLPSGHAEPSPSPTSLSSPSATAAATQTPISNFLASQSILTQYLFFLLLCSLETLAFHLPIRLLCTTALPAPLSFLRRTPPSSSSASSSTIPSSTTHAPTNPSTSTNTHHPLRFHIPPLLPPAYAHPNRISTALLVSSCTKLIPILMVIWEYDLPSSASAVSWAVIVNNVAALEILLDCGYVRAAVLAGVGAAARALVGGWLLGLVGLAGGGGGVGAGAAVGMVGWVKRALKGG